MPRILVKSEGRIWLDLWDAIEDQIAYLSTRRHIIIMLKE
jgi:hypothetical protein